VNHKGRAASLLEKYKDADAKPYDPDYRQKDYRWSPSRERIDIPEIGKVEVVNE
jgi:hypothetical protein